MIFSVKHSDWLCNLLSSYQSSLNLLELISKTDTDCCGLLQLHVWVCPDYVLDYKLKNDQKFINRINDHELGYYLVSLMIIYCYSQIFSILKQDKFHRSIMFLFIFFSRLFLVPERIIVILTPCIMSYGATVVIDIANLNRRMTG